MSLADFIILIAYLLLVLGIGWHFRTGRHSVSHHYLAERSMGAWPIGLSIMVTTFSAVNFIAMTGEIACNGLYVVMSFPVFFFSAWVISRIWMPYFHRLQVTTVYEFLEFRFSRRVRLMAGTLFLLWRFLWMAVALYASGRILSAFTGLPPLALVALCGVGATAYTCMGGMKAVMWTDVLQFVVLMGGIVFVVLCAVQVSPEGLWRQVVAGGRLKPYFPADGGYLTLNPFCRMTFWSVFIGTIVAFMTRYGADQVVMQRYFTAASLEHARRGIWLNAFFSCLALTLLVLLGLVLYGTAASKGVATDGAFALKQLVKLSRQFPVGCAGLLVAGILAATMSSVDSGINACSASLAVDFRLKIRAGHLTLLCGVACTLIALLLLPPLNRHQSIFAIVNRFVNGAGAPLLVFVMAGMFGRHLREEALFWGGVAGSVGTLILTASLPGLALHYYAVAGVLLTAGCCALLHAVFVFTSSDKIKSDC